VVLLLAGAASATEGIGIVMLVPLLRRVDRGGVSSSLDGSGALALLLAGFVLLVGARAVLVRVQTVTAESLRLRWVDSLRIRSFRALADAELVFVLRERSADVLQTLGADMARIGMMTTALTTGVVRSLVVLASVAAGVVVAPGPTAAALAAGAAAGAIAWPLVRRSRALGRELTGRSREHLAITTGFIDGIRQSKAHAAEAAHVDAYAVGADEVRGALLDYSRAQARLAAMQQILAAAALAVIVGVAVGGFGLATARLLPVLVITSRVLSSVGPLSGAAQQIAHLLPAHAAVKDFLRRAAAAHEPGSSGPPPRFTESIELVDVTFRYPGRDQPAYAGPLTIRKGTTVVLIGPSGVGKSTAIDLLAGLLPPTTGCLRIDGVELDAAARRAWRGSVAYVPQAPLLTPASVRENLRWGGTATDDEVLRAVADAGLTEVVERLPDGLDTVLARDAGLSGGERQRLSLARALLRRPALLLLDEPTSALDPDTRTAIEQTLADLRGRTTVVIATHRPDGLARDALVDLGRADRLMPVAGRRLDAHRGEVADR
jgi:ATP-binding cassette subfamily C protein